MSSQPLKMSFHLHKKVCFKHIKTLFKNANLRLAHSSLMTCKETLEKHLCTCHKRDTRLLIADKKPNWKCRTCTLLSLLRMRLEVLRMVFITHKGLYLQIMIVRGFKYHIHIARWLLIPHQSIYQHLAVEELVA